MTAGDPETAIELLRRIQAGDDSARIKLIALVKHSVERQVREILGSNNPLLNDVAWDATVRGAMLTWECRAGTDQEVYGWFRAIARNAALRELRHSLEASPTRERGETTSSGALIPPGVRDGRMGALEEARERLSARTKRILDLRLDQSFSWNEIGDELGMAPDAARMAFNRALAKLKADIQELMLQRADSQ